MGTHERLYKLTLDCTVVKRFRVQKEEEGKADLKASRQVGFLKLKTKRNWFMKDTRRRDKFQVIGLETCILEIKKSRNKRENSSGVKPLQRY